MLAMTREGSHLCWLQGCRHEATGAEVRPGGGAVVAHLGGRRLEFGFDFLTVMTRRQRLIRHSMQRHSHSHE